MGCCESREDDHEEVVSRLKDAIQLKEFDVALKLAGQLKPEEHDNLENLAILGSHFTPLCLACYVDGGHDDVLQLLLKNRCDPNLTVHPKGWTPLQLAARFDKPQAVKALLKHGADIALANEQGETALDLSLQQRHTEVISILEAASSQAQQLLSHTKANLARVIKSFTESRKLARVAQSSSDSPDKTTQQEEEQLAPSVVRGSLAAQRRALYTKHRQGEDAAELAACLEDMVVLPFRALQACEAIPRSDKVQDQLVSISSLKPNAAVVFISHRWLTPNLDPQQAHPDDGDNSKYREVVKAVSAWGREQGVPFDSLFVWIDFACLHQTTWLGEEHLGKLLRGANSLPIFVACSDVLISIDHPSYWRRGWCLVEQWFALKFELPRYLLSLGRASGQEAGLLDLNVLGGEDSSGKEQAVGRREAVLKADPLQGEVTNPNDMKVIKFLRFINTYAFCW